MDRRCVRVLRPYPNGECKDGVIYIDALAQERLNANWGEKIYVKGSVNQVMTIEESHEEDCDAFVARMSEASLEALNCIVGDDVLLYPPSDIPKNLR